MLTAEQIAFYSDNGYLLVEGLLSRAEAAMLREECHQLAARLAALYNTEATWASARELGNAAKETRLTHCHDVQFQSAAFSRLIVDDRLTSAAAALIGSENVQLHHTKMFIKPPEKGSPFPMHQDHPFFPHEKHSMIAAIFHFDDAPLEKGCVRVVPGSHKLGPLEHDPEGSYHLPFAQYPLESSVACPAKAGDVLFFSYLTIHGSGINTSDEARTTVLVQMRDAADRPSANQHESRGQGMMLRGIAPAAPPTLLQKAQLAAPGMGRSM
ncbi:MAG TPA: phytanoyl-CoA dioxygenase family protein [Chloroflexota bacterium]|nr:phytanoyl-CoA dioxygenase family protein [Chloroflexota bacterium]